MELISTASFDDFAKWYLDREMRKGNELSFPPTPDKRLARMFEKHEGKMQSWFPHCTWTIIKISSMDEFLNLLVLDSKWTRAENLVVNDEPRILRNAVDRAIRFNYFVEELHGREKHHEYYKKRLM